MGFLDNVFQVNARRNPNAVNDLKYADEQDTKKAGGLIQRRDQGRIEAINALATEDVLNNSYFNGDTEKYNNWKDGLEKRTNVKGGNQQNALIASDILKIRGADAYYKYIDNSGLTGTYLGPGKRLDGDSTQVGVNEKGEDSLINPMVRTVDPKTGAVYSAQATFGGENMRDIFKESGAEGVDKASVGNVPLSFIDDLDEEYGLQLQGRSGGDLRLSYLEGGAFSGVDRTRADNEAKQRYDNIAQVEAEIDTISAENEKLTTAQKLEDRTARETVARENFGFLSFTGDFSADGDARDPKVNPPEKTPKRGSNIATGIFDSQNGAPPVIEYDPSQSMTISQEWIEENNLSDYTYVPGGDPFDMGTNTFANLSDFDKKRMTKLAKDVSRQNFMSQGGGTAAQTAGETYRRLARSGASARYNDSLTARTDADAAQKFYLAQEVSGLFDSDYGDPSGNQGGESQNKIVDKLMDTKFMKRLQEQPQLMDEFENDPTAFALKYANDTNALYGPPKNVAALNLARKNLSKKGLNDAEIAIQNRDVDGLRTIVKKMKATDSEAQQAFANYIEQSGGDFGRLNNSDRTSLYLNILASIPAEGDLFKTLTAGDTMGNMVESGVFNFNQIDANTAARKQDNASRKINNEALQGFDVDFDINEISKLMFNPAEDGGGIRNPESMGQANFIINTTLSTISDAAKAGPLSSTNRKALSELMQARTRQLKEFISGETDPSIWKEITTFFEARPAATQFFENMAEIEATDGEGNVIKSVEQWLKMPPEARKNVRLYESTSNTEISPSKLTSVFGEGTVESLIFASL